MSSARAEVLARVRSALRDVPAGERPEGVEVERTYRREYAPSGGLVELFAERVADYRATVRRAGAGEIRTVLGAACAERGARRLVVPADLPQAWRPQDVELTVDELLPNEELDGVDGVLTGCALGIAETGTLALDGGPAQGRRALSLLPDLHLCVIRTDQVVGGVPEAMVRLEAAAHAGRPITLISGPSATSDIELDRVEGVHGPRTLVVLIVDPSE